MKADASAPRGAGALVAPWVHVPIGRQVVRVTGSDAIAFLHSMLSQDIENCPVGSGVHALLLDARGHLNADLFVFRDGESSAFLIQEGGGAVETISKLTRFLIRTDASIELCTDLEMHVVDAVSAETDSGDGIHISGVRWDLGGVSVMEGLGVGVDNVLGVSDESWNALRIEARVGRWGVDFDERVLPHEAWLDEDAVSFTKGCFLGQEVVCRIDSRGRVRRFLRTLRSESELHVGDALISESQEVGTVTSVECVDEDSWIALAWVRSTFEPGALIETPHGHARIAL